MRLALYFLLAISITALSACGGGGGGESAPPPEMAMMMEGIPPPRIELHKQAFAGDITTLGSKSSPTNAETASKSLRETGFLSQLQRPVGSFTLGADFAPVNLGNENVDNLTILRRATIDTNAHEAWAEGWTGKNVKVAVFDDFNDESASSLSHGYFTRGIVAQIAPEADIRHYHIDIEKFNFATRAAAYDKAQQDKAYIVSTSIGYAFPAGLSKDGIQTEAARRAKLADYKKFAAASDTSGVYNPRMLFVFSAGNGAEKCSSLGSRHLDVCTYRGAQLMALRKTDKQAGDRVIYVGSLKDRNPDAVGFADSEMTPYSYHAGQLKHDFLVTYDDVWGYDDGNGTSYAAPRVAGAAALVRHKFPNLTGAQLKQVLLRTAFDLGKKGPDEIYGYGALDIPNAMSPIDDLRATLKP